MRLERYNVFIVIAEKRGNNYVKLYAGTKMLWDIEAKEKENLPDTLDENDEINFIYIYKLLELVKEENYFTFDCFTLLL